MSSILTAVIVVSSVVSILAMSLFFLIMMTDENASGLEYASESEIVAQRPGDGTRIALAAIFFIFAAVGVLGCAVFLIKLVN
ncbi:hypothetical protein [Parvularcula oceani]|uniref:hypothetical protein n=1 Tax=Parvularcula oceani TaxID=1247963 RepID=UPI0004E1A972|nr:hypothetical protein [Parvularcula oceani]